MKKVLVFLNNLESWFSGVLLTILSLFLFSQILARYLFYTSLPRVEEISYVIFIWFLYLCINLAVKEGRHYRVSIIDSIMPKVMQKWIKIGADFVWLGFSLLMLYYSIRLVQSNIEHPFYSPVLEISTSITYLVLPFAFFLMSVRVLQTNIIPIFRNENTTIQDSTKE